MQMEASPTDKRIDDLSDRMSEGSRCVDGKIYRLEKDIRELRSDINELRREMNRRFAA
jgi:hypothetical protein